MTDKVLSNESGNSLTVEQTKTMEVLDNSDLRIFIKEMWSKYNLNTFEQLSDLPIPIALISTTKTNMDITNEVREHFDTMTEAIRGDATALEIPFCIVGKTTLNEDSREILQFNNLNFLFTDFEKLRQTSVSYSPEKLGEVVAKIRKSSSENTLILGHTHPITPPEIQKDLLTTRIDKDLKEQYGIREPGLNLSLQDIYQIVYLREHLEDNIRLILAVIMYDGEKVFVEIREGKLVRLVE